MLKEEDYAAHCANQYHYAWHTWRLADCCNCVIKVSCAIKPYSTRQVDLLASKVLRGRLQCRWRQCAGITARCVRNSVQSHTKLPLPKVLQQFSMLDVGVGAVVHWRDILWRQATSFSIGFPAVAPMQQPFGGKKIQVCKGS